MNVFVDMDGVLVDYYSGVVRLFGGDPYPWTIPTGDWHFFKLIGQSNETVAPHMTREFYANLDWTLDGKDLLHKIERYFVNESIYLLSSPWDTPGCRDGKVDWVKKHLPEYEHKLILTSAKQACSQMFSILIDDSEENCRKFTSVLNPGCAYVVPRPWNKYHRSCCLKTGKILDGSLPLVPYTERSPVLGIV